MPPLHREQENRFSPRLSRNLQPEVPCQGLFTNGSQHLGGGSASCAGRSVSFAMGLMLPREQRITALSRRSSFFLRIQNCRRIVLFGRHEQRCVCPSVYVDAGCDYVVLKGRASWERAAQGDGPAVSRELPPQHPHRSFPRGDTPMPQSAGTIGHHRHPQVAMGFRYSTSSKTRTLIEVLFSNRFAQTRTKGHIPDVFHLQ